MQFLQIDDSTTLSDLSNRFGNNLNSFLHLNDADRVPNVGKAYLEKCNEIVGATEATEVARKIAILSTLTSDTDIFQSAALTDEDGWKLLSAVGVLKNTMKVLQQTVLPSATDVMGDGNPVSQGMFEKVAKSLKQTGTVDPSIFNEVAVANSASIGASSFSSANADPFSGFKIPWGEVTLHSSINGQSIEFPVYPEEVSDSRSAKYTTMPDLLYQYEPWQIYTGSGPRSVTYSFHFHRDMWTGDHRDGKANKLIRFCEANLYPKYNGSIVNTAIVTLYVHGSALVRGILTDVNVNWTGPLGLDGWYLECKLDLQITEVSSEPLDYDTVMNKPLIW